MKVFKLESDDKILDQVMEIRCRLMRALEPVMSPYFIVLLNKAQTHALLVQGHIHPDLQNQNGPWRFGGADLYPDWNWPEAYQRQVQVCQ